MAYKLLYIEDLNPGSIKHDLERFDFEVDHHNPELFEATLKTTSEYDILLLDFRLTEGKAIFDAPSIAQTLRTANSAAHKDIPIVLISSEENIKDYYRDFTSQDLFDLSLTKSELLGNLVKYTARFKSIILAYQTIRNKKFDVESILAKPKEVELDYRISKMLEGEVRSNDIYAFASFILVQLVTKVGVLFGEDVLSARLGVSRESENWSKLVETLSSFKYEGIYSESYNRWWAEGLIKWWEDEVGEKRSLRKLSAHDRSEIISKSTGLKLSPLEKPQYAKSDNFWTICKESSVAIDPIDGLELDMGYLMPWQEKEYLSIKSAIKPFKFDAAKNPFYEKYLKPAEKKRLSIILRES